MCLSTEEKESMNALMDTAKETSELLTTLAEGLEERVSNRPGPLKVQFKSDPSFKAVTPPLMLARKG